MCDCVCASLSCSSHAGVCLPACVSVSAPTVMRRASSVFTRSPGGTKYCKSPSDDSIVMNNRLPKWNDGTTLSTHFALRDTALTPLHFRGYALLPIVLRLSGTTSGQAHVYVRLFRMPAG